MGNEVSADCIRQFMIELGRDARGPGRVFLTGGATALLIGWREATLVIDLSMDPEPKGVFESIARLKEELELSIELVSPAHFLPELPGWHDRCLFIETVGEVQFFHYDLYSQALSKIERGHTRDLADVVEMVRRDLVEASKLERLFTEIEAELIRYPSLDVEELRLKVEQFVASSGERS